ncbi:MAG: hypothetical protein JW942_08750 [Opitutales bacterium]|nr:hypothetical protein [Opitutales bacterium]
MNALPREIHSGLLHTFRLSAALLGLACISSPASAQSSAIIIDHNCTELDAIPTSAIQHAKSKLNIAYGHTSHGSQLTTGMEGLASWKGNLYAYGSDNSQRTLTIADYYGNFGGSDANDLGNPDYTTWESATRSYLATHTETNVIIWSWCGQVAGASEAEINTYLSLMNGLETDFPDIAFVYMTCHLDGTGETGNLHIRNEQIRNYCRNNGKILYDFADIESYDPDGLVNYMLLDANDECYYDSDGNGSLDSNWASAWQDSHTEGVDWFNCSPAHTQAINGNMKAYAAWNLWARIAGWDGTSNAMVPSCLRASEVDEGVFGSEWFETTYWNEDLGDWIYSEGHGYQCMWPENTADNCYIWDHALQTWLWTNEDFYPIVYSYADNGWLYYMGGNVSRRVFWNYQTSSYVSEGKK